MRGKKNFISASMIILLTFVILVAKAQLSEEEQNELTEEEKLVNEFFEGFRIEEIEAKYYTCLIEQNRVRREFNYTF